jgi:uncharacterized protein (TIGR03437 family)
VQFWSLVLACCSCLPAQSVVSYLITTVAGNGTFGTQGFGGDAGPATSAKLSSPWGVAVDASGNMFIADYGNHRIRKVSNGVITTVAGNGTIGFSGDGGAATSAQLNYPLGVAIDSSGSLFIADSHNNRIRKVANGVITTVAGGGSSFGENGPATSVQLEISSGIAVDSVGNVYIAEFPRVRKVTPQGMITTIAGSGSAGFGGDGGLATSAQLSNPKGIAVDASYNLFISDSRRVRKVTSQGIITTVAGNGAIGFSGDGGPATSAQLIGVTGVAVDASNNLFIMDGNRVRKVTPQGIISTVTGSGTVGLSGDGGLAISAQLWNPEGVAAGGSGNVFIADTGNSRIRKLVPSTSTVGCVYSVDQSAQSFDSAGGMNSVGVLVSGTSCTWQAVTLADWIAPSPSGPSSGTGLLTYTVSPNPTSASRSAEIWIGGSSLTINQSGVVCSLSVSPRSIAVPPAGLTGSSFTIISNAPDCQWTATASASWILVNLGTPGIGSRTVTYTVGVNTGGVRTGNITAAGQKIYVNQAAVGSSVSSLASIAEPGVVNAASFSSPISPGSFITVYGQNLADTTTDWGAAITNGKLPTSLGGTQILINGKNAFVYFVQPTQLNAIAQPDTFAGSVEVDVITNHGTVQAMVNMVPVSPGLFTYAVQGTLHAAALFSGDGTYVGAVGAIPGVISRPAQAGDYILLFATGLGQTNPPYPVGQILTDAYPVPDLSKVSLLVGGKRASVLFAGLTFAGLFQINIQVPSGVPAGEQAVVLEVAGQSSLSGVYLTFGGG